MATTADDRFIHSKSARLVALVLAVLLAALFMFLWGGAAKELIAGGKGEAVQHDMATGQALNKDNSALDECLKLRVGHVDTLKEEGTINEHQYASFKERAEALCISQNPS